MQYYMAEHSLAEKYLQLEEMEDADRTVTSLLLKRDGTIEFGETDGPKVSSARGYWEQEVSNGSVALAVERTYTAGNMKRADTDVGEFQYSVERIMTGQVCQVGAKLAVQGSIVMVDEILGDEEIGYFSMIDTTTERAGLVEA